MCGITGFYAFDDQGKKLSKFLDRSVETLRFRGPDSNGKYLHNNVGLGHTRLSVIDTSSAASQPFADSSNRYTIIYNGEFYNYKQHRKILESTGVNFKSTSDTEVLLYMYINEGPKFIEKVNGCFAMAIYDSKESSLFITRDRMGINPLLVYRDESKLIFASEMKAILAFDIPKQIDKVSLNHYFQFNYIPGPATIFENVIKVSPGTWMMIKGPDVKTERYYSISREKKSVKELGYKKAQSQLTELLYNAVDRRLVADVPLGAFLSGGIDSSVITALAAQSVSNLNTFSVGFKDEPFFDETSYANLVAKKFKTNHTVFSLSNDDLFENLFKVLDYTDEPFADSSALAVHILSMHTRSKVTVALSGDGADEMFGGYNKHMAHYKASNVGMLGNLVGLGYPLWEALPKSRNGKFGNTIRQLHRFAEGLNLDSKQRYWLWCSLLQEDTVNELLIANGTGEEYDSRKKVILKDIEDGKSIDEVLRSDMHQVLQNDMLHKVDMMSMSNSLEVRTPFLDHEVVDFAFSLPDEYKVNSSMKKMILQDAFRDQLPKELYNRPKHGFEVPLLKWFRNELRSLIVDDLLGDSFIREQGLFNVSVINRMKEQLFSANSQDVHANIWALIVFQYWYKKYFS